MTPAWLPGHLAPLWALQDDHVVGCTVVGEAADQCFDAMVAVAWTIRNRRDRVLEGFKCPAAFSGVDLKTNALARVQYSCFYAGWYQRSHEILKATSTPSAYPAAFRAARGVISGDIPDPTGGAEYYFNPELVLPSWAKDFTRTVYAPGPGGGALFYTSVGM